MLIYLIFGIHVENVERRGCDCFFGGSLIFLIAVALNIDTIKEIAAGYSLVKDKRFRRS